MSFRIRPPCCSCCLGPLCARIPYRRSSGPCLVSIRGFWSCSAPVPGLLEAIECAEVVEVGLRYFGRVVLVVSRNRHCAIFVLTPPEGAGGIVDTAIGESVVVVTVGVLRTGAIGVGIIS